MRHLITSIFILATVACSHTRPKLTVSEKELSVVSEDGRTGIAAAQDAVNASLVAVSAMKDAHRLAKKDVHVAEHMIDREEADLAIAKIVFDAAQETQLADAMLPAKEKRAEAQRVLTKAKAELNYREKRESHAAAQVEHGEYGVLFARSSLELAKLEAVMNTRAEPDAKRRAKFQTQVVNAELKYANAKSDVSKAKVALEQARVALDKQGGPIAEHLVPTAKDVATAGAAVVAPVVEAVTEAASEEVQKEASE